MNFEINLPDDAINEIISRCDLTTLIRWREVSKNSGKVAFKYVKIQYAYRVKLTNHNTAPYVGYVDNMIHLRATIGGPIMQLGVNKQQDDIFLYKDMVKTMYFSPELLVPIPEEREEAIPYIKLALMLLLDCCDVELRPCHLHACRECNKLYTHVTLITKLMPPDAELGNCTSCVKVNTLACKRCHEKIRIDNYKFVVKALKLYLVDSTLDLVLPVIRQLIEPKSAVLMFLACHCMHYTEHRILFDIVDEYED
ncbi:hypothetical protein F-VV10_0276 [Faustovirus]|nr:hypothetical protein F-VV10_0276 [Faustovirus]